MTDEDVKLDKILLNLRKQHPLSEDKELLTEAVMKNIKVRHAVVFPLKSFRVISGVAAVFLITLFVFQFNKYPTENANASAKYSTGYELKADRKCSFVNPENKLEVYMCYLKNNTQENQKYKSFIKN